MEECEALCTRLAIMVDGSFRCLGTPQHLKTMFSAGYSLRLRAYDENPVVMETLKRLISTELPGCNLLTEHQLLITYNVPCDTIDWCNLFVQLEKAKSAKLVEDYSINQSSLDEIYFNVTSNTWGKPQSSQLESDLDIIPSVDELHVNVTSNTLGKSQSTQLGSDVDIIHSLDELHFNVTSNTRGKSRSSQLENDVDGIPSQSVGFITV